MSAPEPAPDDLAIRARPAPVRRISKRALSIVLGLGASLVMVSVAFAMTPRETSKARPATELYSTAGKASAEGLADLPASYADLPRAAEVGVPELGPPLPGDLGEPMLAAYREGRIDLHDPLHNAPDTSAAGRGDSERELVDAAKALEARESGLFFDVRSSGGEARAGETEPRMRSTNRAQAQFDFVSALQAASGLSSNREITDQDRKSAFAQNTDDASIYNPHSLQSPRSPWQVMAGTVIPATLLTGINSDLPGQVVGQVTEPVYDTVTGQTVLIPQGARLIGRYDSLIAYGQTRALIVWSRIIMPDGTSIQIDNLPGADPRGQAGLSDRTDNHTLRIFSAAALSSLIGIGAELAENEDDDLARALRNAGQDGANQAGQQVLRRQLDVQPTLTIRPGWRLRVLVHQDIILKPYGDR